MKLLLSIATIFIILNTNEISNQMIPDFEVTFISGCAAITESKIKVYQKEDKYYADHIKPTYFNGKKIDGNWTIELDKEQINSCSKFLNKAKSLPNKCKKWSSSEFHHIIKIGSETIDINGNCKWDNLDFIYLNNELFAKKHKELEIKKETFINNLHNSINGKWYLQPREKEIIRDDIIVLSKDCKSDDFIEFQADNSFKGNCSNLLNITKPQTYEIKISDGWNEVVFTFNWGKITLERDNKTWFENDATFTFEEINEKELKLKFLWQH